MKRGRPPKPLRDRIYSHVMPCADPGCDCDGCLLWTGPVNWGGYGHIAVDGRSVSVHRVAWKLDNGPIPDGLVLDHVKARGCRHRHCIKLAHLEPVTQRENLLRGDTIIAAAAAVTHCPQRHEYTPANTYINRRGCRLCRTCRRDAKLRWLAGRLSTASP